MGFPFNQVFSLMGIQIIPNTWKCGSHIIIADLENRLGALSDDVKQGIKDTVSIKIQSPVITTEGGTTFRPPSVSIDEILKRLFPWI